MKTPSVRTCGFNEAKIKGIQSRVWKTFSPKKAPLNAARSRSRLVGVRSRFLQEGLIANKTAAGGGRGDSEGNIGGSSCSPPCSADSTMPGSRMCNPLKMLSGLCK